MQKEKQTKKNNIINYIFFLVLIIVIILLLLSNCTKKKPIEPKPNGKVDIFEINCEKQECKVEPTKDKQEPPKEETKKIVPTNKEEKKENKIEIDDQKPEEKEEKPTPVPTPTPDKDEEADGEVTVKDQNITWSNNSVLNIFTNSTNSNNGIIAPEDSNTYEFKVKNNTIYNVKYSITFEEINNSNINIKYKLKKGNTYIAGDESNWVNYNELIINNQTLNTKKSETYYLEWKWISGENDALIGNQLNSKYQLKMKMEADELN